MTEIVLLITSSIIGAGFATGAELIAFFGDTAMGPAAICVLYFLFTAAMTCVFVFCKISENRFARYLFCGLYCVFFVTMTAGIMSLTGAVTTALALATSSLIVLFGFSKMARINKFIMFFVLAILLQAAFANFSFSHESGAISAFGAWRVLIYAGLNCCMFETILPKSVNQLGTRRTLIAGVIAAALVAVMIYLILSAILYSPARDAEMPILFLSNNFITRAAVFLCVFSSQMICLSAVVDALTQKCDRPFGRPLLVCVILSLFAFGFGFQGFRHVIGAAYPIVGLLMVLYASGVAACYCWRIFCDCRRRKFLRIHNSIDGL
jgi:uncharacterized membrane protein YkvI